MNIKPSNTNIFQRLSSHWEVIILMSILLLASALRLYHVSVNPPGLYIDEASIGYNAYTILTKGVDEFGTHFPLWFRSFGDYKMPVYIYLTAFSMAVFGKTEFAVRLPSVIAGIGNVFILYLIVKRLMTLDNIKNEFSKYLPILSAFLLAISPWAIQFSRGGFEVNVGCFFYLVFSYFLLTYVGNKKPHYYFLGLVFSLAAVYTYHSFRIITPLTLLVVFGVFFLKKITSNRNIVLGVLFCALLYFPIFQFSFTTNGSERFSQTSTFSEYPAHTLLEKLSTYPLVLIKNYVSFFSFQFLYIYGDGIGRHQIAGFGVLPMWTFPFLFIGMYYIITFRKRVSSKLIMLLLLMSPLPAILARPSPQSLRSLLMVMPLTVLISLGVLYTVFAICKKRKILFTTCLVLVVLFESIYYLHFYYVHYPKVNLLDWGAGYKEIVTKATQLHTKYPRIIVDSNLSFAPVYFHFYNPSLTITMVGSSWMPEKNSNKNEILYIRPNYGEKDKKNVLDTVYLPNANHEVYAELKKVE